MARIQVHGVSEVTVDVLTARAAERGLTLNAFLRTELDRLAGHPTSAEVVEGTTAPPTKTEIVERIARRDRRGGPTVEDTVAEIRRIRESS